MNKFTSVNIKNAGTKKNKDVAIVVGGFKVLYTKRLCTYALVLLFISVGISEPNIHTSESFETSQDDAISFSENILLSTDDTQWENHVEPTLSISNENDVCVGWKNAETDTGGGARVSFTRIMSNEDTWSTPMNMPMYNIPAGSALSSFIPSTPANTRQSDPWIIWREDAIYYAYLEFSQESLSFSQITVAKSVDNGINWEPQIAAFPQHFADKETMVISDNGTIFVVYDDVGATSTTMRLTRSTDNGNLFLPVCNIDDPDEGHLAPYITLNNQSEFFIASSIFYEYGGNINLYRSSDGNNNFNKLQLVNDDGDYSEFTTVNDAPSKITIPVIRFDQDNRLYILWSDIKSGSFDVYLRYSDDYGISWSNRIQVNPITVGDQWQPDMDIDSEGNLHICFYDEQDDMFRPYYRKISFFGEARNSFDLGEILPIATEYTSSSFTRPGDYFTIRVDSNDFPHIVWTDGRSGNSLDVYYAKGSLPKTETSTNTTTGTTDHTSTTYVSEDIRALLIAGVIAGVSVIGVIALFAYRFNRR
ncbi:MAG: sialidase family protein [Candidatus Thorarchaeota archaeon]